MKAFLFLLLSAVSAFAQFGGESIRPWEPRDIRTKAGLFAQYDVGQASTVTLNGSGISKVADKSWVPGRLENLLVQSEAFNTTWLPWQLNAFGATDTGAAGAGSFANTTRTLDPLGGNTADFIQENAVASAAHAVYTSLLLPAGAFVIECQAKKDAATWFQICAISGANNARAWFDLANGVVGSVTVGGAVVIATSSIAATANGFYKCRLNVTLPVQASWELNLEIDTADGSTGHAGDNTRGLFLWGAQLRRATSSSTYVATTTVVEDASRDLLQSTAANQPIYDTTNTLNGKATAYFDGSAHYLRTAAMASLVQPETVVFVGKQVTWGGHPIYDGNVDNTLSFIQYSASPIVTIYAGNLIANNSSFTVGSYALAVAVFNGAQSSLKINNTAETTGNVGASNGQGLTLGRYGTTPHVGNIAVSQVLLFNQVLATPELNYVRYGGLRDVGALP